MPNSRTGHSCRTPTLAAKAEGALLALAAGDALGWPQEMRWNTRGASSEPGPHIEFKEWRRRSGDRFRPYEEVIGPGDYSDDTQLTLAIARSRTKHGEAWWKAFTRVELPLWTIYERGGGGATKRAANAWASGRPPWKSNKHQSVRQYFGAGGNGVAMRVLPHALFLASQEDPTNLIHDVVLDGSATHGHPRALVGAAGYAYAAWSLARRSSTLPFGELLDTLIDEAAIWSRCPEVHPEKGAWLEAANSATKAYEPIWHRTVLEMRQLLEIARKGVQSGALADDHSILESLGCFGRTKGAGTSSAVAAIYLAARHAVQPEQGILRAAFESGADTDTIAAMTGGLLGCLSGVEWLPGPWLGVQDADYLKRVASSIAAGPEGADQSPVGLRTDPRSIFSDLSAKGNTEVSLGGSIRARAITLAEPKALAKSITLRAWRLETAEGQTMYVTKVYRRTKGSATNAPVDVESAKRSSSSQMSVPTTIAAGSGEEHSLYAMFCQLLPTYFGAEEMTRKSVGDAMDLVPTQVKKWLERAEHDGWIRRTSTKPEKFSLSAKQLSLLPPSEGKESREKGTT